MGLDPPDSLTLCTRACRLHTAGGSEGVRRPRPAEQGSVGKSAKLAAVCVWVTHTEPFPEVKRRYMEFFTSFSPLLTVENVVPQSGMHT